MDVGVRWADFNFVGHAGREQGVSACDPARPPPSCGLCVGVPWRRAEPGPGAPRVFLNRCGIESQVPRPRDLDLQFAADHPPWSPVEGIVASSSGRTRRGWFSVVSGETLRICAAAWLRHAIFPE